jgi:hypothetical protein
MCISAPAGLKTKQSMYTKGSVLEDKGDERLLIENLCLVHFPGRALHIVT